MRRTFDRLRFTIPGALAFVLVCGAAAAQEQTTPPVPAQPPQTQSQNPEPAAPPDAYGQQPAAVPNTAPPAYGLPPQLNLKAGTFVNLRINGMLSSDKSHVGDLFTATLSRPIIVDGVVVAPRGQMVYGRVAVAEKAHGGKDSELGLELTSITLADGTQAPLQSRLVSRQGPATPGSVEAGTVVGTTAVGAAVGGIAARGTGAAIGAGAGAAAGIAAVMMTHNHPTVVYPETLLTFEITTPVTINTSNAAAAFRFAGPEDYYQGSMQPAPRPRPAHVYGPGPYPYGPYYYPYSPYYWGPSFGVGIGFGSRYGRRW